MPRRFIYPASPVYGSGVIATNPPNSCLTYASQDFETGAVTSPWTTSSASVSVTTAAKKNGVYGCQIQYLTGGTGHVSDEEYIRYDYGAPGLAHFFCKGWFYITTAGTGPVGRKLMYLWTDPANPSTDYSTIVSVDDYNNPNTSLRLTWTSQGSSVGGTDFVIDCGTTPNFIQGVGCNMSFNTWYFIEWEVKANTASVAPFNGEVRIWVTPSGGATEQVMSNTTGWSLNRASGWLRAFRIGEMVDVITAPPQANEVRYLDDVSITSCYTGPT